MAPPPRDDFDGVGGSYRALPLTIQQSLKATATLSIAELYTEGQASATDAEEWPFAQISEVLDGRTCPLCAWLDGKILKVGSAEYARYRGPSHINCRRILVAISRDEPGVEADFTEPDAELLRKHGHYHLDPDKYAEYKLPAEPAGRHVIVRRVKHLETGEIGTQLDWAPWYEQTPKWKRELVHRARATADQGELTEILEKLGLTDLEDAAQLRAAHLLGLKDRVEGFVSVFPGPPWNNPAAPAFSAAADNAAAEAWARKHLPGLQAVDYSGMDLAATNELNRVAVDLSTKLGVEVPRILPIGSSHWPAPLAPPSASPIFFTKYGLAYDPDAFSGDGLRALLTQLSRRPHATAASRTLAGLFAHELGHALLHSVPGLTYTQAATKVHGAALRYRRQLGADAVKKELGDYAWNGGAGEAWSEAFSAYWDEVYSLRPETKALVEEVLRDLFPGVSIP